MTERYAARLHKRSGFWVVEVVDHTTGRRGTFALDTGEVSTLERWERVKASAAATRLAGIWNRLNAQDPEGLGCPLEVWGLRELALVRDSLGKEEWRTLLLGWSSCVASTSLGMVPRGALEPDFVHSWLRGQKAVADVSTLQAARACLALLAGRQETLAWLGEVANTPIPRRKVRGRARAQQAAIALPDAMTAADAHHRKQPDDLRYHALWTCLLALMNAERVCGLRADAFSWLSEAGFDPDLTPVLEVASGPSPANEDGSGPSAASEDGGLRRTLCPSSLWDVVQDARARSAFARKRLGDERLFLASTGRVLTRRDVGAFWRQCAGEAGLGEATLSELGWAACSLLGAAGATRKTLEAQVCWVPSDLPGGVLARGGPGVSWPEAASLLPAPSL